MEKKSVFCKKDIDRNLVRLFIYSNFITSLNALYFTLQWKDTWNYRDSLKV